MPSRRPPSLDAEIARRIRELRAERGWSQPRLAAEMEALGFRWTGVTVAEIEGKRQRAVSVPELIGLAHTFDVGVKKLLGVTFRDPPTRPGANRLQVTPTWTVDRREVWSLVDTGRRSSSQEQELRARLDALLDEMRRLDAEQDAITSRFEVVRDELGTVEDELKSTRERKEET